MRFAYGKTRFVILTGHYAIKIPRLRPLRPFIRLIQLLWIGRTERELRKYDDNLSRAALKYLGAGVIANRVEYRLYRKCPNRLLVPTLYSFHGLVNIQMRGAPVSTRQVQEMRGHPLWPAVLGTDREGAHHREQFCTIDGVVCLADYGNDAPAFILENS